MAGRGAERPRRDVVGGEFPTLPAHAAALTRRFEENGAVEGWATLAGT
jgi:hypothetical protein